MYQNCGIGQMLGEKGRERTSTWSAQGRTASSHCARDAGMPRAKANRAKSQSCKEFEAAKLTQDEQYSASNGGQIQRTASIPS
jgi:hypothetical protein